MKEYPRYGVDYLEIIRGKNKLIDRLREERKRIQEMAVSISAPPPDKEKVSGGEVHGLETRLEKIDEYNRMIDGEMDELLDDLLTARRLISRVANQEARCHLISYYLLGFSYEKIARIDGISKTKVVESMTRGKYEFNNIYVRAKNNGELELSCM